METKYEPVFGDQSLFDGASDDAVLAIKDTTSGRIHIFTNDGWIKSGLKHERHIGTSDNQIAMRSIVRTPIWTVEDQKAGKLPEVGAEVMCMDDSRHNFVGESIHAEHWALCHGKTKKVFHIPATAVRPVETDTERQQRLKEEWCSNALDSASILSGMREYELKRLGGYIGNIYDALLSGELPVPKGSE